MRSWSGTALPIIGDHVASDLVKALFNAATTLNVGQNTRRIAPSPDSQREFG